jgi:hypothetical protein|tara:strand:+ start:9345 stop:9596 length:252 start_codon:yes stop_codon:yes gene_type:complete
MIERVNYYIELAITLCGFDGSDGNDLLGWFVVGTSTALVIYAFYAGLLYIIRPGEYDRTHIKYLVLDDEKKQDSPEKDSNYAH